jgi:hypothetical protein
MNSVFYCDILARQFELFEILAEVTCKDKWNIIVPVTTTVASSNPAHGEVYLIQHYVIKFVSDLRWVCTGNPVSFTNKTDLHDIAEILLKAALFLFSFYI